MNEYLDILNGNPFKPEKAKKILEEHGMQVTLKEAAAILDFLNMISNIAIATYLDVPKA